MKEWTREKLYRRLNKPEEIMELHEKARASVFRQSFHIQPVSGLLNDPNGFFYRDGVWHLFYQWCPWGSVHGMKHWYHVTSTDLLTWENKGVCIRPDTYFDNKGVFSGTALPMDDKVYLYYTGYHMDDDWTVRPYTCFARLQDNGRAKKFSGPLFGPNPDYTENQRDPQILYDDITRKYYIMLGAQTRDGKGCAIFYESENPTRGWRFRGQLSVPGFEDFGEMWECPSIEHLGDHDVLIFCPQHLHIDGHGEGTNHNGYIIGTMDFRSLTFTPDGAFHVLDFGFDSYAAQCAVNQENSSKAVLIAWMGLPDASYPTDDEEWSGCLTLPRELTIRHRRLIQRPLPELLSLRGNRINPGLGILPATAEITVAIYPQDFDMKLFTKADGSGGLNIHYDDSTQLITIDRSGMKKRFNQELGETRSHLLEHGLTSLRIFIDHSSIEIFVNDGDAVFTSRIFPDMDEHSYVVSECRTLHIYEMASAVEDNFII